jgi:hypothetical protein
MIRQDYILRLVMELTQVLLRAVSLRHREEYEQALREVDEALGQLGDGSKTPPDALKLDDWIAVCERHEQAMGLMVVVGDLLRERGDLLALRHQPEASLQTRLLALGLLVEALLTGRTLVSAELLDKVEALWEQTRGAPQPVALTRRLFSYFEARGQFGRAEDALFEWMESGAPGVVPAGLAFYDRLLALGDIELERGNLPRPEVEGGKAELLIREA